MIRRGILVVVAVAAAFGPGGSARADFDHAMGYFRAGKFLEAAAEFQGMVDATPGYDYGHYMLGHCLLRMGRSPDAEQSFRRAIEIRRDKPEYHHGLAVALKDQRRYVMALRELSGNAGLVKDRRTAYSYLALRGYLFAALRRWPEAIRNLDGAVSIKRDPTLLDLLGRSYFAIGRYGEAASAFSAVCEAVPSDPGPVRMLAESLLQFAAAVPDPGRKKALYAQAAEAAERLRRRRPEDPEAAAVFGRAALGAGRYLAAAEAFRSALLAQPGACHVLVNLSRALLALDRAAEAERSLADASKCAPAMIEVHEELGKVYLRQHKIGLALDAFRQIERIQPSAANRARIEEIRMKLEVRDR